MYGRPLSGGAAFWGRVEFSGGALFTHFVKGAGFSLSLQVKSGTEGNPSKITDTNSQDCFSGLALMANSLCPGQEKRTMHKPKV
jgi:hypothetical protein